MCGACRRRMHEMLEVAPYKPEQQIEDEDDDDDDYSLKKGVRVLGLACSSNS